MREARRSLTPTLTAAFTGLLVLATILLILVGAIQYWLSRDTARRQLRAYVGFESGKIWIGAKWGPSPVAHIQLKNFGLTPATDVIHRAAMVVTNPAEPSLNPLVARPTEGVMVVSPAQPVYKRVQLLDAAEKVRAMTEDERTSLNRGKHILVYGLVTYRDAFGKRRTTRYRLLHSSFIPFTDTTDEGVDLAYCADGNDAE